MKLVSPAMVNCVMFNLDAASQRAYHRTMARSLTNYEGQTYELPSPSS